MKNVKQQVVIGVIKGYSYDRISHFVESLFCSGYSGDLVLLGMDLPAETVESLKRRGAKVVLVNYRKKSGAMNSWARFWPKIRPLGKVVPRPVMRRILMSILHLMDVRHFHVKDFLLAGGKGYDDVFVTDVRDVIFQDDPFLQPLAADVEFFQECDQVKIMDCPFNSQWISERFGAAMLERCGMSLIHCFGTIRATRKGMLDFLDRYENACLDVIDFHSGSGDQGIFNTLIVTGNVPRDHASVPNLTGPVATLGWMKEDTIPTDELGRVIELATGRVIPVVHQHDRFPQLAEHLIEQFGRSPRGAP